MGCGAAYISPSIPTDDPNVDVVVLTDDVIRQANQSLYDPKPLPQAFFQTATSTNISAPAAAVPQAVFDRPAQSPTIVTRLPPSAPVVPYRIGVGDVVLLATPLGRNATEELAGLLAAQNQRQGYTVQDDGAIAIANVGSVALQGLTLQEAQDAIFNALVSSQIDPSFALEIAQFNSQRVSVGGGVAAPKAVAISLRPLTLEAALLGAGGVQVQDQSSTSIRIYRDGVLYQIPLETYLERPDVQKTRLAAGDSIFVDERLELTRAEAYFREQIALAQIRQTTRAQALAELEAELTQRRAQLDETRESFNALLAADAVARDYVYLTGEVSNPGRFPMPFARKATLADALFGEGGLSTETANPSQVYLLRGQGDAGRTTAYNLDFRNAANLVLATRLELRPNDVIFATEQPVTKWSRVVQQITPNLITSGVAAAN
jgi:polysaccharide export outer membrane protein